MRISNFFAAGLIVDGCRAGRGEGDDDDDGGSTGRMIGVSHCVVVGTVGEITGGVMIFG